MYTIKYYPKEAHYNQTFEDVRVFLKKHNDMLKYIHFHWSRWEWMFARASFDVADLSKIVIFQENNIIKGLLTFEDEPGVLFLIYDDEIELKHFMINYIITNKIEDHIIIPNDDEMKTLLLENNYEPSDWKDPVSRFSLSDFKIEDHQRYTFVSLEDDYRLDQIHSVLWKGFDHEGDPFMSPENLNDRKHMTSSPNFKKKYTFVAVYQNKYVSYAGIWYEKNTKTALIEPVATVPEHRKQGLAKSLIYRAIKVAQADGATDIFVGSVGPLYTSIGFKFFDDAPLFKKIKK